MNVMEMIDEKHLGKFYISDTFENSLFFVSKKHGLIDVKDSLFYSKLRFVPLSNEVITCAVEFVPLMFLRDYGISHESYYEFIKMLGGNEDEINSSREQRI